MVDATYQPAVYRKQGGSELVVASGGTITVETGGVINDKGKDQILGVASTTIDMSDDLSWAVYSPVDCKYRTMTSAAKQGVQKTIPAETWHVRRVRKGSAFTNFSGCTLGQLERM